MPPNFTSISTKMIRLLSRVRTLNRVSQCSHSRAVSLASFFTSLHDEKKKSTNIFTDDKFAQVVSDAEKIVGYPTSFMSLRCLLSDEMNTVAMYIRKLVGTKHPLLKIARGLVFNGRYGMQTRGLIVLLLSKAARQDMNIDDANNLVDGEVVCGIHNKQRQLAEIIETIHLANLIHNGIVNLRDLDLLAAENPQSIQDLEFGNKITVLTGDFLLANACTNLAKLEMPEVVESVSNSISNMMESNFVYLDDGPASLDQWEDFTYLSRGSLLANCCSCALKLSGADSKLQKAAYDYGKYLSFTHQIREELRPFINGNNLTERPNLRSHPIMHYINETGSDVTDDFDQLVKSIRGSRSVEFSQKKCRDYADRALNALDQFRPSSSRSALENIVQALVTFPR